ncbi:MAG: bifunctional phosphoribosyl-AMP cyclohydrolase/phosphoribosyl-ATP diphosphatase HisIE [Thermovirgaceae bacterium]
MTTQLDDIVFNEAGLVPVIVQNASTGMVLMMAWANRQALELTLERGVMIFWSRSRKELWEKGKTSGNRLRLRELRLDCDGDTLLALVDPSGPACHRGTRSCFSRIAGTLKKGSIAFFDTLVSTISSRSGASLETSYTARLLAEGRERIGQKIGEEGVETAIATAVGNPGKIRCEMADLLYHCLVALQAFGLEPADIWEELESRHGVDR